MQIAVKVEDAGVKEALNSYLARSKNLTPATKIIGEIVRTSIVKNFEQGGRPAKWTPSKKSGGMTLIKTARLMKSITANAYPDRAEIGTNVIYAAIQQLGSTIKREKRVLAFKNKGGFLSKSAASKRKTAVRVAVGRAHDITIPARPYLMVQDEDWVEITNAVNNYLLRRFG